MAAIAFLGMGSMGSRMALNLVKLGHEVCVWNRHADRTNPLAEAGARVAKTPRHAAAGADVVISMLRDNQASSSVWCDSHEGALAGMKPGTVAIECSTLTVEWVRKLNQYCEHKSIAFLDAPVAGSRPQAKAAQLIFFTSGNKMTFEQVKPILEAMGSVIHYAGACGAGTSIKLAVNTLFGIQLATMAELIAFLDVTGNDKNRAIEILTSTPVCSPAAKLAAHAMLTGAFAPMFPIKLVEKDFSYAIETAHENGLAMPMTQAAWKIFRDAVDEGIGEDNITGLRSCMISRGSPMKFHISAKGGGHHVSCGSCPRMWGTRNTLGLFALYRRFIPMIPLLSHIAPNGNDDILAKEIIHFISDLSTVLNTGRSLKPVPDFRLGVTGIVRINIIIAISRRG